MSFVECCGQKHCTPFCPLCGTKLRSDDPLFGLFSHVKKRSKDINQALAMWTETCNSEEFMDSERHRATLESVRKRAERWQAWADALAKIINV